MTPDVKRTFDKPRLLALAQREGLAVRGGRMECPHRCAPDPRGASVSNSPDGALWHCKRCGEGGSVIDLLAAVRGVRPEDVLERGDELLANLPPPKLRPVRPPMNGAQLWERLATSDLPGETYLRGRGLERALPFVRFNVGGTGDPVLDGWAAKGYRVAVPLRDVAGAVVDFQVRAVTPAVSPSKRSLCGERPKGTAFGRPDLARGGGRIFIAEGMADVLSLQAAGVVAIGAPGCDQLRHLVKLLPNRSEVVLCAQNDVEEQSQRAFAELGRALAAKKHQVLELATPERYKDLAEWLADVGLEQFREALRPTPAQLPDPEAPAAQPSAYRFALTDLGNAERLVARHGADLRFSKSHGWLAWDGTRWEPDETDQVMRFAKDTVRSIYGEAAAAQDSEVRKALADWARRSESEGKLRAMVSLASSESGMPVRALELDADPWLLNCRNGTLELRTGQLRPHRREDLQTRVVAVDYSPEAACPRWERFLEEVQPDPEVRAFLQRWVGYSLTGAIREHAFVVHFGSGRNGKSVFTNLVLAMLGDYARQMPTELLMAKHGDAHPTERSELLGVRMAVAAETEEGKSLNVALVKQITGGDQISARKMHRDFFTFTPTHKLMLATNHRPRIKESKDAIWQRVKLVPWSQRFLEGAPGTNPNLEAELREELPGILRWAVEGCLQWQSTGLAAPAAVQAATDEYRSDEDPIAAFVDERCVLAPEAIVTVRELREAYEKWCEEQGEKRPESTRSFNERLGLRGCQRVVRPVYGTYTKVWLGLGLRTPEAA